MAFLRVPASSIKRHWVQAAERIKGAYRPNGRLTARSNVLTVYPHYIRLRGPWQYRTLESPERAGTLTVPGSWSQYGLTDYWGRAELRRRFHWMATHDSAERVWLCAEGCVGQAHLVLNGRMLGTTDSTWGRFRFDVTDRLRAENELLIELDAGQEGLPDSDRYGLLGCGPGDWTGRRREPVGGIIGGVYLAIESRRLALRAPRLRTDWSPEGGAITVTARLVGDGASPDFTITLDGRQIEWNLVDVDNAAGLVTLQANRLSVQPWWPRPLGQSHRHDLELTCRHGSSIVWRQSWPIGFRTLIRTELDRWHCNGRELRVATGELWPGQSFAPSFGEDASKPFAEWQLACYTLVRVVGHLGPSAWYRFCDRAGLLVMQDVPSSIVRASGTVSDADEERVSELSAHPSLALWCLPAGQQPAGSIVEKLGGEACVWLAPPGEH